MMFVCSFVLLTFHFGSRSVDFFTLSCWKSVQGCNFEHMESQFISNLFILLLSPSLILYFLFVIFHLLVLCSWVKDDVLKLGLCCAFFSLMCN